ncbi:MAG: hypothetical protein GY873_07935 [Bosea sp.]|uniref:hypothetical protein n=1 Tax=Bosea sp. (in: a-proteobacteria) TaxID=1871050 RepID=UPI0023A71A0A|nr:hypothetical protein [Bosea sp. (in: a-proteobacteria)]MCP4734109.1 hypothetical protein [Bosea sp. (in: a-proteobacteria)]
MDLTDVKSEAAFNWTVRAMRGGLAALAALVLCKAQQHFVYPIWFVAFGFFAFSMIDKIWRFAAMGLCFLMVLTLVPPQFFNNIAAFIERIVR